MKQNDISILLILLPLTLSGCTTYKVVNLHQEKLGKNYTYYKSDAFIVSGDTLRYTLKDGSQETISVQSTTPHGIITSTAQTVDFKDMISLKRKEISIQKSVAALVTGTMLATVAMIGTATGLVFAAILTG